MRRKRDCPSVAPKINRIAAVLMIMPDLTPVNQGAKTRASAAVRIWPILKCFVTIFIFSATASKKVYPKKFRSNPARAGLIIPPSDIEKNIPIFPHFPA